MIIFQDGTNPYLNNPNASLKAPQSQITHKGKFYTKLCVDTNRVNGVQYKTNLDGTRKDETRNVFSPSTSSDSRTNMNNGYLSYNYSQTSTDSDRNNSSFDQNRNYNQTRNYSGYDQDRNYNTNDQRDFNRSSSTYDQGRNYNTYDTNSRFEPSGRIDYDNTGINVRDRSSDAITPDDQSESYADRTITQKIRQAIMADDSISMTGKNIKVITINGIVTLRGPVLNDREKNAIALKANNIPGVVRVDNQLEIASRSNY